MTKIVLLVLGIVIVIIYNWDYPSNGDTPSSLNTPKYELVDSQSVGSSSDLSDSSIFFFDEEKWWYYRRY